MSAPIVFQFPWRAKAGEIAEEGRGLLSGRMKSLPVDEFEVAIGSLIAAAYPMRGEVYLDHQKILECPCRRRHKLIWFSRMAINLQNGRDTNSKPASFECYGLGLECEDNKFGVRFMRDGTVKLGLDEGVKCPTI